MARQRVDELGRRRVLWCGPGGATGRNAATSVLETSHTRSIVVLLVTAWMSGLDVISQYPQ